MSIGLCRGPSRTQPEPQALAERQATAAAPVTSLSAPAAGMMEQRDALMADGMSDAVRTYYQQHLAARYRPVVGKHFLSADFNTDGRLDWAGLLIDQQGRIDLLVILSQPQAYTHQLLDKGLATPQQLSNGKLRLQSVVAREGTATI